jgi:succinylglutamate desuccinylase
MKKLMLLLGFFTQLSLGITARRNPILSSYWISPHNDLVTQSVAKSFEIVRKLNGGYEVLVPFPETQKFLSLVPEAELLQLDISQELHSKFWSREKGYHDFESVQSHLQSIFKAHPEMTSIEPYGLSMENRPLMALKLGTKGGPTQKPSVLLTASTHGDELITVEVLFGLLDSLVNGYGQDSRLTHLVDKYDIYFVPVVNPDGYVRQERYANGIDPNRDYPWPEEENHSSNPCITAIIKFYSQHQFKGSIDFHASGELIMYPWAYTYDPIQSLDENIFDKVTTQMAEFNGYTHGQISKVIYVAPGSSADFYYWKHHARSLGIELGRQKVPPTSQIAKILKENTESTWTFIESID